MTLPTGLTLKSSRNRSPTWRELAVVGSTRSSGYPHLTPRKGTPSSEQHSDQRHGDRDGVAA